MSKYKNYPRVDQPLTSMHYFGESSYYEPYEQGTREERQADQTLFALINKKDIQAVRDYIAGREKALNLTNVKGGYYPLHVAIRLNHLEMVAFLLEAGANPNVCTITGETPLHLSVTIGNTDQREITKQLLAHNATINVGNASGITPLHNACASNNTPFIALLLANNADVNALTDINSIPLHYAASAPAMSFRNIKLLLRYKADLHYPDKQGERPLHILTRKHPEIAQRLVAEEFFTIVTYLIRPSLEAYGGNKLSAPSHYLPPELWRTILKYFDPHHILSPLQFEAVFTGLSSTKWREHVRISQSRKPNEPFKSLLQTLLEPAAKGQPTLKL